MKMMIVLRVQHHIVNKISLHIVWILTARTSWYYQFLMQIPYFISFSELNEFLLLLIFA